MSFKKNFYWGAATASYQIEGAYNEDGKSLNIWDTFCQIPGRIDNFDNGNVACDHYHRYKEDVKLMKEIGLKAYRFSLNWSRILPNGTGEVNQKGIDFYNNLIDELLAAGIEPFVTLYHWDLPLALDKLGGWRNPLMVQWFENYAKVVAEHFSDRVKHFMTINEPQVVINLGYYVGSHAPGLKLTLSDVFDAQFILLKAHGAAVKALRTYGKQDLMIGYAPCYNFNVPKTESPEDIQATKDTIFHFDKPEEAFNSLIWYNDPIIFGKFPEREYEICAPYMPKITPEDMALISQPIDFVGHNNYWGSTVSYREGLPPYMSDNIGFSNPPHQWPTSPDSLYWGTKFLAERYQKPILITENGRAVLDEVSSDGKVHDPVRIHMINGYLKGLKKSISEGTDVIGYFYWSLMDNFEWTYGYHDRFGLIYVDYPTCDRTLKDSAYRYKEIIESNGEIL